MDERLWTSEVCHRFPKKWIVMVNLEWDATGRNKLVGFIHSVVDTWEEARTIVNTLDNSKGDVAIMEGFDDTPHVGGPFT